MVFKMLEPLAQFAYSFNGSGSIIPYIVFALIWEAFYLMALLSYYGIRKVIKCLHVKQVIMSLRDSLTR